MSTYVEQVVKEYNKQAYDIFVPKGSQYKAMHEPDFLKALGTSNAMQRLYVSGGLFADANLQRPVMNLTLNPMRALANRLPVKLSNMQKSTYAYLTGIGAPTGDLPTVVCDDGQVVGDLSSIYGDWSKGRMSFTSKTGEMDAIVERLSRGVHDDLYFVGDVRGVSGPVPNGVLTNQAVLHQSAVLRQIQMVGRALQRQVLKEFWSGDPTNGAVNTAAIIQMTGMETLVANDYGSKSFITGSGDKTTLNSVIVDFEDTCIGAGRASDNAGLFYLLEEAEDTVYNRAALQGYANVEWALVVHPIQWSQMTRYIPCEALSGQCGLASQTNGTNVTIVTNDLGQQAMAQSMRQNQTITLNGRTYPVILDDSAPLVKTAGPPIFYTGDIYFLPLSVDNEPVLFFESIDYGVLSGYLQPIAGGLGGLHGAVDGGTKLVVASHNHSCFSVTSTMKLALCFLAPHLAFRITDVRACVATSRDVATGFSS